MLHKVTSKYMIIARECRKKNTKIKKIHQDLEMGSVLLKLKKVPMLTRHQDFCQQYNSEYFEEKPKEQQHI